MYCYRRWTNNTSHDSVATSNFQVIISLPNGNQVTESISPGSHRIFYEADVNLVVEETNEENNVAFLDVNVAAP